MPNKIIVQIGMFEGAVDIGPNKTTAEIAAMALLIISESGLEEPTGLTATQLNNWRIERLAQWFRDRAIEALSRIAQRQAERDYRQAIQDSKDAITGF